MLGTHISKSKIEKVNIYTSFGPKGTHISGCKDVYIYNLAKVIVYVSIVTVHLQMTLFFSLHYRLTLFTLFLNFLLPFVFFLSSYKIAAPTQ